MNQRDLHGTIDSGKDNARNQRPSVMKPNMRYVYLALIVLFTAAVLIFKFQNLTSVTVSLLGMSATLPVSTLVILVYLFRMVTGSALFGLVRSWIHGATRPR